MPSSSHPQVYHITHIDNLAGILRDGALLSDAAMTNRGGPSSVIGMSGIKARRLQLLVYCHAGTKVGEYVPFYFCPRSIMLFVIHKGNHPNLAYRGGQGAILHLEADVLRIIAWASSIGRKWAISLGNASTRYARFECTANALGLLNWQAIANNDFTDPDVSEGKQAEFLVHESFPWTLVDRIGVQNQRMRQRVRQVVQSSSHRPSVDVLPSWYF